MTVAVALLLTLDRSSSVVPAAAIVLLLGTGAGFVMQPSLLAAQNSAAHQDLGTATSTALLFRTLGNTIGTPIFGGILNAGLVGAVRTPDAVADALRPVFGGAVVVGVVSVAIALTLPDRPLREHTHVTEAELAPTPAAP
jgi:MFS family permease